jgi:hypothetical protein
VTTTSRTVGAIGSSTHSSPVGDEKDLARERKGGDTERVQSSSDRRTIAVTCSVCGVTSRRYSGRISHGHHLRKVGIPSWTPSMYMRTAFRRPICGSSPRPIPQKSKWKTRRG